MTAVPRNSQSNDGTGDITTVCLSRAAFLAEAGRRMSALDSVTVVMIVVDIDRFHRINGDYGLTAGDAVLVAVAERIASVVAAPLCMGRLGSNDFAILVKDEDDDESLKQILVRLQQAFEAPMRACGRDISVGVGIGAARCGEECGVEAVLARAHEAMRGAKADGGGTYRIHSSAARGAGGVPAFDGRDLQEALERDELVLALQPIFDARTGALHSAEALARWHHKTLGPIPPGEFIPFAERNGLILDLGWWAISAAVHMLARWPDLVLAVNVSPLQFRRHGFALRVQELLAEHRVQPERLEVEVTESALIGDADIAERTLRQFRAIGVKVGLDDFGTGYSSLGYLQRMAFDKIKIDRSFARGFADGRMQLVRAIIDLGHSLGMTVVAEGVETSAIARAFAMLGCDLLQGFGLGVPVSEAEFGTRYLSGGDSERAAHLLSSFASESRQ